MVTKSYDEELEQRKDKWIRKFAWLPVLVGEHGKWLWLEWYEEKVISWYYYSGRDTPAIKFEYRWGDELNNMITLHNIGHEGCACGDYKSENLIAHATCRKSGGSPECSIGIAHLLTFNPQNEEGLKELGGIVDNMLGYGADCVVLVKDNKLK